MSTTMAHVDLHATAQPLNGRWRCEQHLLTDHAHTLYLTYLLPLRGGTRHTSVDNKGRQPSLPAVADAAIAAAAAA